MQPTWIHAEYDIRAVNEKQFVAIKEIAATHLTRNAFGGGHQDLLYGLPTVSAP